MRFVLLAAAVAFVGLLIFLKIKASRKTPSLQLPSSASVPDRPVSFGFKMIWFAVRTNEAAKVATALGYGGNTTSCNWKTGIEAAYRESVYVSPPVAGWTFVVGATLPSADPSGSEQAVGEALKKLSEQFGEAQWFVSHRVVEYHGWAQAVRGKIVRHYSYLGERGEILQSHGARTAAEPANLFDSPHANSEGLVVPDEDTVMAVAASWSLDPTKLDSRTYEPEALGLLVR